LLWAGVIGAHLAPRIILILGGANLIAEGFAMAARGSFATREVLLDRFANQFNNIRGLTRGPQIMLARHSRPGNIAKMRWAMFV
jgi:hypothetical protein